MVDGRKSKDESKGRETKVGRRKSKDERLLTGTLAREKEKAREQNAAWGNFK